jgi:hypothetical protein
MSLDWDLRSIENREAKKESNPYLDGHIYATMYIGMPTISEKNVLKFYARMKLYNETVGEIWNKTKDEDGKLQSNFPTFDQTKEWIGLKTNASPFTPTQFLNQIKKILSNRYDEIVRNVKRKIRETN